LLKLGEAETKRLGETVASQMKKIISRREIDDPVRLTSYRAGSDKIADYSDGKECGSSDPFDI
jgi:hypothetical protein